MKPLFVINTKTELLALHRVFIEAKFSLDPNDFDIGPSSIVSALYDSIFQALKKDGQNWDKWLENQRPRILKAVKLGVARIQECEWQKWSHERRVEYVSDYASPLTLSSAEIEMLISKK
ncbi:hypothetical protein [Cerasicoccus fimbriatus]|uniref:hypothetical protein n=1 Tax=Cerasicoccus fimbriatus TaxID=3014554 RepID=UPI0022B39B9E|nr:hypothetical protein [Cerasicoccus sp. TK19100]